MSGLHNVKVEVSIPVNLVFTDDDMRDFIAGNERLRAQILSAIAFDIRDGWTAVEDCAAWYLEMEEAKVGTPTEDAPW